MKEKIKFPDAYVCDPFSSPYETVGLPFEGGQAVVETTYQKRKVSSGAELGALLTSITRNPIPEQRNGCRSTTKSSLPFARINRDNLSPSRPCPYPIPKGRTT